MTDRRIGMRGTEFYFYIILDNTAINKLYTAKRKRKRKRRKPRGKFKKNCTGGLGTYICSE